MWISTILATGRWSSTVRGLCRALAQAPRRGIAWTGGAVVITATDGYGNVDY